MTIENIKNVGVAAMLIGGTLFTGGLGTILVCDGIECHRKELERQELVQQAKEEADAKKLQLSVSSKEAELRTKERREALFNEMDADAYAEFLAKENAKASEEAIAKANAIRANAEAELSKVRLECTDKITSMSTEYSAKVLAAENAKNEAIAKYNEINSLFTNRDEILKVKREIEELKKASSNANATSEELNKKLSSLVINL